MDDINMQKPEVPIIIIERDEQPQAKESVTKVIAPSQKQKWLKRFLAFAVVGCMIIAAIAGYYLWNYYYNIGVSVSISPEQNIEKLKKPVKKEAELAASTEDEEGVAGSVWLDALQSVLKRVPVMNAVMKPVSYQLVPVENGRIEGANPDKVFFYLAPDDSMRGFRVHKGDIVLTVPAQSPVDGAIMLMNYNEHRYLRKVKILDDRNVLLQSYDREYEAETVPVSEIGFISRCVKVTFELT